MVNRTKSAGGIMHTYWYFTVSFTVVIIYLIISIGHIVLLWTVLLISVYLSIFP